MRAVLRHRDFRLLWAATTASTLGDRIVFVALALYVTEIGSPSDVGLVLAANAIPVVLFVLIGGVWADRLERHRVMVVTDVVRAILHGTLALLVFFGPAPIWAIVAIEAAFGTAEAFFNPASTGLVPQTVPEGELQQANAANSIVSNAAELIGPAIATALVLGLGAAWAFAFDAATFVFSALLLARLRPRARGERAPRQRLADELRAGWRELRSRQWAWVVIASTSVALLVALGPYFTLGPTVAEDRYGSTGVFGALAVAMGAGTVIGSVAGFRLRPRHPIRFAMFDVSWDTAIAQRIPPHAISRVSSFDWMGSLALLPLGYLLAGPMAEAFGATEVLVTGGLIGLLVAVAALATPGVWRLERLQPNSPRPSSGVEASA